MYPPVFYLVEDTFFHLYRMDQYTYNFHLDGLGNICYFDSDAADEYQGVYPDANRLTPDIVGRVLYVDELYQLKQRPSDSYIIAAFFSEYGLSYELRNSYNLNDAEEFQDFVEVLSPYVS